MTKPAKIIAAALAGSLAMGLAVPASAAAWTDRTDLRQDIRQLDRQIDRALHRDVISHREARMLERQVDRLETKYRLFARNGFTRGEVRTLQDDIRDVKRQLVSERRDHDSRADSRYDRHDDRRGNNGKNYRR